MKHKLLGNKYGSRCITWCPTQLQISSPIAHQPTFHSVRFTCEYTWLFLCEDTRSFNHFPIMLANSIARQIITGIVIPFHIHNVVAQLQQNGELRSTELFDVFIFDGPSSSACFSSFQPKTSLLFYIFGDLSSVNLLDSSSISRISLSVPEFSA